MHKKIIFIYIIIFLHHHSTYSFWGWREWKGFLWSKHTKISPRSNITDEEIDDMSKVGDLQEEIYYLRSIYYKIENIEKIYNTTGQIKIIDEDIQDLKITNFNDLLKYQYDNLSRRNQKYNQAIKIIKKHIANNSTMTDHYTTHVYFLCEQQTQVNKSLQKVNKSLQEEENKARTNNINLYNKKYKNSLSNKNNTIYEEDNKVYEYEEE